MVLTVAPIDRNLIDTSLLEDEEVARLDGYHQRVRETLTPLVDPDIAHWLAAATQQITIAPPTYCVRDRACWSASTWAITIETRLPVGMCRNSFGPCAFECGPRTPVTTNCACGNFSPSIAMNGMLPPSPI